MALYEYEASNAKGHIERGRVAATSAEDAQMKVSSLGLNIKKIDEVAVREPVDLKAPEGLGRYAAALYTLVGPGELMYFFRQMAMMIKAGFSLAQAVDEYAKSTRHPQMKSMAVKLSASLSQGNSLSQGMEAFPNIFSPMATSMVKAGEDGGFLERTFNDLDRYYEQEVQIRNAMKRATAYPKFLLGACIAIALLANFVGAFLGVGVVFDSFVLSPLFWMLIIGVAVFAWLFVRMGKQNPGVKRSFDLLVVSVPGFAGVFRRFAMARFGRALGALYRSGVQPATAVEMAAQASGNSYIEEKVRPAALKIQRGETMTSALIETGEMPSIVQQMLSTGEKTGEIDTMMEKMAEYFEDDAQTRAKQLTVIMGVVALIFVLAIGITLYISAISRYMGGFQQNIETLGG